MVRPQREVSEAVRSPALDCRLFAAACPALPLLLRGHLPGLASCSLHFSRRPGTAVHTLPSKKKAEPEQQRARAERPQATVNARPQALCHNALYKLTLHPAPSMGGCTSRNTGTEVQQAVQPRPVPRSGAAAPASASSPRPASPVGAVAVEISAPLVFAQPTRVDREHQAAEQAAACDQSLDASMLIVPDDDMEASSPGTMPLLDAQPQPQPQPQRSTFRPVQAIVRGSARGGSAAGPTTTTARFPSSTISSVSPTPPVRTGAEQMRVQMALWGTQAEDVGRGDSDHARHGATSLQAAQISAGARRDRRLGGVVPGGMAHVAPVSRNASREAGSMAGRRPDAGPGRGLMPDRPAGRQYTAPHAAHQEATVRQGSCITPPSPITDLSGPDAIQDTLDTLLRCAVPLFHRHFPVSSPCGATATLSASSPFQAGAAAAGR